LWVKMIEVTYAYQIGCQGYDQIVQVEHHFIAFVEKDGKVFELDGRKTGPICHGETKGNFPTVSSVSNYKDV